MKKIVLSVAILAIIIAGVFIAIKSKDSYDPTKYYINAQNGINIGSAIDFKLPDQFNKSHSLNEDTKILILVFAKDTAHTVKEFLKKQPKGFLESKKAIFIADISPMPVIIRNTFAMPDLQKSNYSILLIYDKNLASKLKNEKNADKITIVYLNNKKIEDIKYITTEKELEDILK